MESPENFTGEPGESPEPFTKEHGESPETGEIPEPFPSPAGQGKAGAAVALSQTPPGARSPFRAATAIRALAALNC